MERFHQGKIRLNQHGVTLIEMLVVVAILAVIMAFAIPAYRGHLRRSNRSDGMAALLTAAQQVERFRTSNMTYEGATVDAASEAGFYELGIVSAAETYTITATATGTQTDDTGCTTLTINQAGVKTPAACW